MAAPNDLKITNRDNSKTILLRAVAPMKQKVFQPPIAIPLVNTSSTNTILFRFIGQSEEVTFTFALFDDGTDVAEGTGAAAVTTASEQKIHLLEQIYGEDFDVDWELAAAGSGFAALNSSNSMIGVIVNLEFDHNQGYAGNIIIGSMSFQRGRIGDL